MNDDIVIIVIINLRKHDATVVELFGLFGLIGLFGFGIQVTEFLIARGAE